MAENRSVTLNGQLVQLLGDEVKVDLKAPDAKVLDKELKEVSLSDSRGKIRIVASVPSLDTPICDMEIKRFDEFANHHMKDTDIIFVSMDLPFAQKRFCDIGNIERVMTFSDHRDGDFGMKYGVLVKDLRLLARAVFIIDKENIVRHVEYVPEMASHPNYDKIFEVIENLK
ncbi:MAG: thiol peroxidase [Candidatus Aureabacteria bacterium]|nr:thiol peroxidase [Candidatus Auribacterota bacterium]